MTADRETQRKRARERLGLPADGPSEEYLATRAAEYAAGEGMLEGLLTDLGVDVADPARMRLLLGFLGHRGLIQSLVDLRNSSGLTQAVVAARMGTTVAEVRAFESWDSDPTLAGIRRYALAVGARIESSVLDV